MLYSVVKGLRRHVEADGVHDSLAGNLGDGA